jgi:RimJ/RimL family protein N-acetyltransferase
VTSVPSDGDATPPKPIYVVEGELVALAPLEPGIIPLWERWLNDLDVTRTLGALSVNVHPRESQERAYDRTVHTEGDVSFAIYERASRRPIGSTSLREISYRTGTATFSILIGERDCWDRGFGTEATRLVLDFAFHALGLHNVLLTVYDNNPRGIRAYEKAGFRVMGRRREAYRLGQERYDVVYMDALAADFESPVLARRIYAPQQRRGG